MKKIYVIALLLIASPCTSSFLCSDEYPDFKATGVEIKGRDNLIKACGDYMDVYNANIGKIKTWQGHVEITDEIWASQDKKQPIYQLDYDVDFQLDRVADRKRCVSVWKSGVSYDDTGKREPLPLIREAAIVDYDKQKISKLISVYKSYSYMDEVPKSKRLKSTSILSIAHNGGNDKVVDFFFDPMEKYSPITNSERKRIFSNFDTKKLEDEYRKGGKTEERIREIIDILDKNGFPNHWKLSSGDGILYFDVADGSHYTFDMKRGGCVVFYKSGKFIWNCELQQIAGVWIPLKITEESVFSNNHYKILTMTWTAQKINEPIDEKLWTVPSLGVRRGTLGFDARTGTSFTVDGDEYLPSPEQEEFEQILKNAPAAKFDLFRIVSLFVGVALLCLMFY
jgi:hypothetical protein